MKILYIEPCREQARLLFSQLLATKQVSWDMVHCERVSQAKSWLERDNFDIAMLSVPDDDGATSGYESFLTHADCPVIVLSLSERAESHLTWVQRGADDCLFLDAVSGAYLMRRLRFAVSRNLNRTAAVQAAVAKRCAEREADYQTWPDDSGGQPSRREDLAFGAVSPPDANGCSDLRGAPGAAIAELASEPCETAVSAEKASTVLMVTADQPQMSFERRSRPLGVDHEYDLRTAIERIRVAPERYAAVVVEQEVVEQGKEKLLSELTGLCLFIPCLALMVDRAPSIALSYINRGVDDCLLATQASTDSVYQAIEMARLRQVRFTRDVAEVIANLDISDRRTVPRDDTDRREVARYLITRPMLAIPVLPNGAPDKNGVCEAMSIDVSHNGLGFQLESHEALPSRNWVVGIETDNAGMYQWQFANVAVKNVGYVPGAIRLGAKIRRGADDLLRHENLWPRIHPEQQRLLPDLPLNILEDWVDLGVLRPNRLGSVRSCPECQSVCWVGGGCVECGSGRVRFRELIHHFACAYVGDSTEFSRREGSMRCPKCLTPDLVAGADFEVITTEYECPDCGGQGSELEQVGECLACRLRFPFRLAQDCEIHGYDVDRLDLLALLSSAR